MSKKPICSERALEVLKHDGAMTFDELNSRLCVCNHTLHNALRSLQDKRLVQKLVNKENYACPLYRITPGATV